MAQLDDTAITTTRPPRYETPTFDPRSAFAWTLRSGEVACLKARQRPSASPARCYETPTFDPRGAFAWTLRSGEVARLERLRQLPEPRQLDVLASVS